MGGFPDSDLFDLVKTNMAVLRGYPDNAFTGRRFAEANGAQFVKTYGDFTQSTHMAHAVYGFFNNGGSRCFVVTARSAIRSDAAAALRASGRRARRVLANRAAGRGARRQARSR